MRSIFTVVLFMCVLWSGHVMSRNVRQKRVPFFGGCWSQWLPSGCPNTACNWGMAGICVMACSSDDDCAEGQKCCSNGCGWTCQSVPFYKPGTCPNINSPSNDCSSTCGGDAECGGTDKCCEVTFGCRRCVDRVPPGK